MTQVSDKNESIRREVLQREIHRHEQEPKEAARQEKASAATASAGVDGIERGVSVKAVSHVLAQSQVADDKGHGPNPFAGLRGHGDNPPARSLGLAVGMDKDASPSAGVLAKLGQLEQALLKQQSGLRSHGMGNTDKVRQGMMLCLSDGVAKYTDAKTRVPRGLVANISESLAESHGLERAKAALTNSMYGARGSFPMGMDVNAFVQAVLRESYLLQNEILKDYADEVERLNELRKKIRAKINQVREWKQAIAKGEDPGDLDFDLFLSDDDFAATWQDGKGNGADESGDNSDGFDDDLDPDAYAGNLNEAPAIPLPATLVSIFKPFSGEVQSDALDAIKALVRSLATASDPVERADNFKEWCTNHGFAGESAASAAFQMFQEAIPQLPASDVRQIFMAAAVFAREYGEKNDESDYGDNMIALLVNVATPSQVQALLDANNQELDKLVYDGMGSHTQTILDKYQQSKRALDWPDDPALASLGDLYAEYLSLPTDDPRRQVIRVKMRAVMWEKTPEQVKSVFEAMLSHDPKADETIVSMMLQGCDGKRVFADANPQQWEFLGEAGPELQEFLDVWAAAGGGASGLGLDNAEHQLQQSQDKLADTLAYMEGNGTLSPCDTGHLDKSGSALTDANGDGQGDAGQDDAGGGGTEGRLPTKESLDEYIQELEEELETAGGDAQLANMDLQNALQQEQQTLQMMSNISKMLHDTAMSIIRKIGS